MKNFFLGLLVLTLYSCKEEEVMRFDKLSAADQEIIRSRGTALCRSEKEAVFNRFKNSSNQVFTSNAYERGDGFEFVLKEGTTTIRTVGIKVWKRTSTVIYFYITDDRLGNYFLRIQKADNEEMIDDLLGAYCLRPEIYTSTVANNGPLTMRYEYSLPLEPGSAVYEDTFSLSFEYLAFFAGYQIEQRTIQKKDTEGDDDGSLVEQTSSLEPKTVVFNSDNYSGYTQKFCKVYRVNNAYRFSGEPNALGFKVDLNSTTDCPTTLPAGWDLSI